MTTIKEVKTWIMNDQGLTSKEADRLINATREEIQHGLSSGLGYEYAEDILHWDLGLEMDYIELFL